MGDAELQLIARALSHRCSLSQVLTLEFNTFTYVKSGGAWLVWLPGIPVKAGIEMDVTFDKTRHNKGAAEIDNMIGRDIRSAIRVD
jgi:hypothetical protein